MTKQEVITLQSMLVATYPRTFAVKPGAPEIWTELLADLDAGLVLFAVKKMICQSPYPPTIADIRKHVAEMRHPENNISAADAWALASRAGAGYGVRQQKAGLASLPEPVRSVVKSIGWQEFCLSENQDVLRGEFIKLYQSYQSREQELMVLPARLQQALQSVIKPMLANSKKVISFKRAV